MYIYVHNCFHPFCNVNGFFVFTEIPCITRVYEELTFSSLTILTLTGTIGTDVGWST